MSSFTEQADKYLKEYYKEVIIPRVEKKIAYTAQKLVEKAFKYREEAPEKHDFTGNLLNSIVVCTYKKDSPVAVYYVADQAPKATRVKMTKRDKPYHFDSDYSKTESTYIADIETNKGLGIDDAKEFFATFNPNTHAEYAIVVAYPTEYADFVERFRRTTGFAWEYTYAKRFAAHLLLLPKTYETAARELAPF